MPSKDQLRLFIRASAIRQKGTSISPWVVSDDLIHKYKIANKFASIFLPFQSKTPNSSNKRKATNILEDSSKRSKIKEEPGFKGKFYCF